MPKKSSPRPPKKPMVTQTVNHPDAVGIDLAAEVYYVAVPADRDPQPVRSFGTTTDQLWALADWLQKCGIRTVAMEATGVYWIPLFELLEARGLAVCLVNAQHVRHVPGRKSDVDERAVAPRGHRHHRHDGADHSRCDRRGRTRPAEARRAPRSPLPEKRRPNRQGVAGGLHVGFTFLTEVGPDLSRFTSPEDFSSWLGLCPNNKVSGKWRLSVSTRPVSNRLATALRMAAQSLSRVDLSACGHAQAQSPLGDWFRRMRAKLGPAGAVTAAAHKLARIIYTMVKTHTAFDSSKLGNPTLIRQRKERSLRKQAALLGFSLQPADAGAVS